MTNEEYKEKLKSEIAKREKEIVKLKNAIKGIYALEQIVARGEDATSRLSGVGPYVDLGPGKIASSVLSEGKRNWTVAEVIKAAADGGKDVISYSNTYSVFFTALSRLAGKGEAEKKIINGKTTFCSTIERMEDPKE